MGSNVIRSSVKNIWEGKHIHYVRDVLPFHVCTFFFSLLTFVVGIMVRNGSVMLCAVGILFLSNVIYGLCNLKDRLLFFSLHCGFFLFILTRPLFSYVLPNQIWRFPKAQTTYFVLVLIYLTLACLFVGALLCEMIKEHRSRAKQRFAVRHVLPVSTVSTVPSLGQYHGLRRWRSALRSQIRRTALQQVCLIFFVVALLGTYLMGAWKLKVMAGHDYIYYYLVNFDEVIPWYFSVFPSILPYVLCFYLATMPPKRQAMLALFGYATSAIPLLLIGKRSEIVLNVLLVVLYVVLRQVMHKDERWITRRVVISAVIFALPFILIMGFINYARAGTHSTFSGPFMLIADALYKQGVSFKVLGYAYDVMPQIHALGPRYFVFGDILSTLHDGFVGRIIFGLQPLPSTNSVELALHGHSLAHTMSYFAHPNYLGGEGYGNSFMLELYADFGMGGVCVGSCLTGALLIGLMQLYNTTWFGTFQPIFLLTNVFYMPRSSMSDLYGHLYNTRFVALVILIILTTLIYERMVVPYVKDRESNTFRFIRPTRTSISDNLSVLKRGCDV